MRRQPCDRRSKRYAILFTQGLNRSVYQRLMLSGQPEQRSAAQHHPRSNKNKNQISDSEVKPSFGAGSEL